MIKCQSHIVKEFKTRKALCVWPNYQHFSKYPEICGGDVVIKVNLENEPHWGGTSAALEVTATCSRCRHPYFDGFMELNHGSPAVIANILNEHFGSKLENDPTCPTCGHHEAQCSGSGECKK